MERPQRPVLLGVRHTSLAQFLISAPYAQPREYTDENEPVSLQVVCTERRDKDRGPHKPLVPWPSESKETPAPSSCHFSCLKQCVNLTLKRCQRQRGPIAPQGLLRAPRPQVESAVGDGLAPCEAP